MKDHPLSDHSSVVTGHLVHSAVAIGRNEVLVEDLVDAMAVVEVAALVEETDFNTLQRTDYGIST
jgi:hypothetical protein